jgi:hypothetical protein
MIVAPIMHSVDSAVARLAARRHLVPSIDRRRGRLDADRTGASEELDVAGGGT